MNNLKRCICCGKDIAGVFRFCPFCDVDQRTGWKFDPPKSSDRGKRVYQCGRCQELMNPNDRFCVRCGTSREEGRWMWEQEYLDRWIMQRVQPVYGPAPMKRQHKCTACGHTYTVAYMIDHDKFCPMCGGETRMTELGYDW